MRAAFVLAAFAPVWVRSSEAPWPAEALAGDDICSSDPAGEECAVALRQLRGEKTSMHLGLNEEKKNKCVFADDDSENPCDMLLPSSSIAETGSYCDRSEAGCSMCRGAWCANVRQDGEKAPQQQEETLGALAKFDCVFADVGVEDPCSQAVSSSAIAERGSYCDRSEVECSMCRGSWCAVVQKDEEEAVQQKEIDPSLLALSAGNESSENTTLNDSDAVNGSAEGGDEANSFCCFSGSSASDLCGTCYPTAVAESGSYCASRDQCGGCGGTWCKKQYQCVFAGEDSNDLCGTAYSTAIAEAGSFCDRSEEQCSSCHGSWCSIAQKAA